jgi:archaellum component FlaC
MEPEFTPEQINQIVRAARVLAPGFTEEQLQWLIDCQPRLADSVFCEAAHIVARFERERGVSCANVLDACERLLQEKTELESEVAHLEEKLQAQQNANHEAEEKYRRVIEAAEQSRKELAEVRAEREKAEAENKRIDQEVEEYRQKANVTEQEMNAAAQLKAQVEKCGFSLEQTLELSREFAGHEDAREKLAAGLKKYRDLTGYLKALEKWADDRKRVLESEVATLESQRRWQQSQIKSLEEGRHHLETVIANLQADVVGEEEMRKFYQRYYGVSGLMEYLASWDQVIFLRCDNPVSAVASFFDRSAAGPRFWTDKPLARCPHCGLATLIPDKRPYQALNWPVGAPLKLQLGE